MGKLLCICAILDLFIKEEAKYWFRCYEIKQVLGTTNNALNNDTSLMQ